MILPLIRAFAKKEEVCESWFILNSSLGRREAFARMNECLLYISVIKYIRKIIQTIFEKYLGHRLLFPHRACLLPRYRNTQAALSLFRKT